MTPEQRSDRVCKQIDDHFGQGTVNIWLRKLIAAAIREAVQEERETCAKILEDTASAADVMRLSWRADEMRKLAHLIRQRGQ